MKQIIPQNESRSENGDLVFETRITEDALKAGELFRNARDGRTYRATSVKREAHSSRVFVWASSRKETVTQPPPTRWTVMSDDDGRRYLIPVGKVPDWNAYLDSGEPFEPPAWSHHIEGQELAFERPTYGGKAIPDV